MSKKAQSQTSNHHPNSCPHTAAHCIVYDNASVCSSCLASRVAIGARFISGKPSAHIKLTAENYGPIFSALYGKHAEMQEDIEQMKAAGVDASRMMSQAASLFRVIRNLSSHWSGKRFGETAEGREVYRQNDANQQRKRRAQLRVRNSERRIVGVNAY